MDGSGWLSFGSIMMKRETIPIADVYVPIKRRATLEQKRVDDIAASILDKGLQAPILVRADGACFVDALEFPDGQTVLLHFLKEGQRAPDQGWR